MLFLKVAVVFVSIGALLGIAQQQQWYKRAGISSSCQVVQPPFGATEQGGQWWSCHEGLLSGYPNLERDNCHSRGITNAYQVWYCPFPILKPTFD